MPTFDSLLPEIHDMIFEEVISSTLPCHDYERDHQEDRVQFKDVSYRGRSGGTRVKWQKTQTAHPADALLLVNHQVRAEAKGAWKRVVRKLPCHVDVMFAAEAELRPTFLSVYTDATHFDVVHAQFRVVGLPDAAVFAPEEKPTDPKAIWWAFDRNMPHVNWMFFDLLHRFLKAGPRLSQPEEVDQHITVRKLEINVLSPPDFGLLPPKDVSFHTWLLARRPRRITATRYGRGVDEEQEDEKKDLHRTQMRPEWLCDWIAGNIRRLTAMDYSTMHYGGIFYERIDEIVVLLDGEERAIFKLGQMLSELYPWGSAIQEWKEKAIKERLETGLSVVNSNE
ncbi:putative carbohydrate esterase family 16 protein [Mycena sanguinolenta]|uniref:Putative carbohydrate esterase family 16 protein n=1 Tax=Mycena sanguinolenta TaxID=230812 RepID=A0A8H6XAT2_9AGAR|nr:putative carbohydrate esterase family 16 protein [Mycena sanguinolenta]